MEMIVTDSESHHSPLGEISNANETRNDIISSSADQSCSELSSSNSKCNNSNNCIEEINRIEENNGQLPGIETRTKREDSFKRASEGEKLNENPITEPVDSSHSELPSINHQSAVVPKMEPYLEDGSLDGTKDDVPVLETNDSITESNTKQTRDDKQSLEDECTKTDGIPTPSTTFEMSEQHYSSAMQAEVGNCKMFTEPDSTSIVSPESETVAVNNGETLKLTSNDLTAAEADVQLVLSMSDSHADPSLDASDKQELMSEQFNQNDGQTGNPVRFETSGGETPNMAGNSCAAESNEPRNGSDEFSSIAEGLKQDSTGSNIHEISQVYDSNLSTSQTPGTTQFAQQVHETASHEGSEHVLNQSLEQQSLAQLPNQLMDPTQEPEIHPDFAEDVNAPESERQQILSSDQGIIQNQLVSTGQADPVHGEMISDHHGTSTEAAQHLMLDQDGSEQHIPDQMMPMEPCAGATYTGHEISTQRVYVDETGAMSLSTVDPPTSMSSFHSNADNSSTGATSGGHVLVEMTPMAAEGTYVDSQVQYVDATSLSCDGNQEGVISDAQAAELLMRVSEQRPTLSLQGDPSCSSVPYVQVQLAQTVEGITHLVEVPASALGYLPSTLVYSTPVNSGSTSGGTELTTWVVEAPPNVDHAQHRQQHGSENKFSDIVSASIEAIGFPESVTPGTTILSQAEQILIASDNSGHQHVEPASSASVSSAAVNFDFDDSSSNSSLTMINNDSKSHNATAGGYPRPKRESIESRINRLLRGANAPPGPETANEDWMPPSTKPVGSTIRTLKLNPVQSGVQVVGSGRLAAAVSSPATVTVNLNDSRPSPTTKARIGMRPTLSRTGGSVSIPTIYTSTTVKPAQNSSTLPPLPPGNTDYFMPRGVSKRKAQTQKVTKVNPLNPNCIDADPAPPEETQVKLVMNVDTTTETEDPGDDLNKDDDDEYNRLVLLQARQRQQTESSRWRPTRPRQGSLTSELREATSIAAARRTSEADATDTLLSLGSGNPSGLDVAQPKRARLSFPPEKYADLESTNVNLLESYMTDIQTPRITYSSPRARQIRATNRLVQEPHEGAVSSVAVDQKDTIVQTGDCPSDSEDSKRMKRLPRIIRQSTSAPEHANKNRLNSESEQRTFSQAEDEEEDVDMDSTEQVIVIGLDETGKHPSEEELTAIIQAAMTKKDKTTVPEGGAPRPTRSPVPSPPPAKNPPLDRHPAPFKRKAEEDNGVEEEHAVHVKVIRTYDRSHGLLRRKPRSKPRTVFLDIFDFKQNDEDEEEGEEEDVDDLEPFSQALADEENRLRLRETQRQNDAIPAAAPNADATESNSGTPPSSRSRVHRGRGRSSSTPSSASRSLRGGRGKKSRGLKTSPDQKSLKSQDEDSDSKLSKSQPERNRDPVGASSEDDNDLTFVDDVKDNDYRPTACRARSRRGGRSRGRRSMGTGRRRSVQEEVDAEVDSAAKVNERIEAADKSGQEDVDDEDDEDDEEEQEMKIPGLPTKPCPQCQERFTTREGFLEHVTTHSSAKCLMCSWKNSSNQRRSLMLHMLSSHRTAIPAARGGSR